MTYAFDTLKFTQRLEKVGVARDQAEAHAELARDMILGEAATKADVQAVEAALRSDFSSLRSDFGVLRSDVASFRREIEGSLRELELRMTIKLGAIVAAGVALATALQKLA